MPEYPTIPPLGFRWLEPDEILQKGDLFYMLDMETWTPTDFKGLIAKFVHHYVRKIA